MPALEEKIVGLENQITALKEEASINKRYFDECEDLSRKLVQKGEQRVRCELTKENQALMKNYETLQKYCETLQKNNATLRKENQTLMNDNRTLKEDAETLQKDCETLRKENQTLQNNPASSGMEMLAKAASEEKIVGLEKQIIALKARAEEEASINKRLFDKCEAETQELVQKGEQRVRCELTKENQALKKDHEILKKDYEILMKDHETLHEKTNETPNEIVCIDLTDTDSETAEDATQDYTAGDAAQEDTAEDAAQSGQEGAHSRVRDRKRQRRNESESDEHTSMVSLKKYDRVEALFGTTWHKGTVTKCSHRTTKNFKTAYVVVKFDDGEVNEYDTCDGHQIEIGDATFKKVHVTAA